MKTRGIVVTLFLLAFSFAPPRLFALPPPPPSYSPILVSPYAGQVLHPGQTVKVEWKTSMPGVIKWPSFCEVELWLSVDGGRTYTMRITPSMDPNTTYFYWVVPNTPASSAVLDVRFGCEPSYPEGFNPQTASAFVIAGGGTQ